jgi:uncharacterized protein (TIGR00730 family)
VRIAVFCGSSTRARPVHLAAARALGDEIARRGHSLIYGGGRTGLMGAVADAALAGGALVHGVILREFIERDVHHLGLDELYAVDDMRARKAGLDERAEGFVALPGGLGTLEEITEILSFRKLALHHRLLVLLNVGGFFDPLIAQIERGVADDLDRDDVWRFFGVAGDPGRAVRLLEAAAGLSPG